MNRLEELGRVDAEKAFSKEGKRNLRDEKSRIVRELKADGGSTGSKYITKKKTPYITKKSDSSSSGQSWICLLYTSPSPRDRQKSRMPSSA